MDPLTFIPRSDIIPRILDDLCDADLSLREIAMKAKTTVEALSLWMASPDIAARIALIQSTIAQRTRLAATCFLPTAVRTVNRALEAYEHEEDNTPINPGSVVGHEYRRRSRESARRAASLLLRLAHFSHAFNEPRASARGRVPRLKQPRTVPLAVAPQGDCQCGVQETPDTGRSLWRPAGGTKSHDDLPIEVLAVRRAAASRLIASAGAAEMREGSQPRASHSTNGGEAPNDRAAPTPTQRVIEIEIPILPSPASHPILHEPARTNGRNGHRAHNGSTPNNEHWP